MPDFTELALPHPDLLLPLVLLAVGIVTALAARSARGAVGGGTLLLAAIVATVLREGDTLEAFAVSASCLAAGALLLIGYREEGG